jgi:hypothetical protein
MLIWDPKAARSLIDIVPPETVLFATDIVPVNAEGPLTLTRATSMEPPETESPGPTVQDPLVDNDPTISTSDRTDVEFPSTAGPMTERPFRTMSDSFIDKESEAVILPATEIPSATRSDEPTDVELLTIKESPKLTVELTMDPDRRDRFEFMTAEPAMLTELANCEAQLTEQLLRHAPEDDTVEPVQTGPETDWKLNRQAKELTVEAATIALPTLNDFDVMLPDTLNEDPI